MADKTSKWLIGCGIGCGAVILIILIILGIGYLFVKDTVQNVKGIEASSGRLEAEYGEIRDYVPPLDGRLESQRIEAFLAVRDRMASFREEMANSLTTISEGVRDTEGRKKNFWQILGIVGKGLGTIPMMIEFYSTRNDALLDVEMGPGEYTYIYVIAYYSWLEKDPADGPPFPIMGDDDSHPPWERDEGRSQGEYEDEVGENRAYRIARHVNWIFRSMIQNQLDTIEEQSTTPVSGAWRMTLERELEELKEDRGRLPWEDRLPDVIASSFSSFRSRLEASYDPILNPLEVRDDSE